MLVAALRCNCSLYIEGWISQLHHVDKFITNYNINIM